MWWKKHIVYLMIACKGYNVLVHMYIRWYEMLERRNFDLWDTCKKKKSIFKYKTLDTTLCYKVCQWLVAGRWFSPGTPTSSTNKTDCHNITEILSKVVFNTITTVTTLKTRIILFMQVLKISSRAIMGDNFNNCKNVNYSWNATCACTLYVVKNLIGESFVIQMYLLVI